MKQRLIDADAIEFPDANYWEETHEDEDYGYGMGVGDCIEIIEKMPTIDAVPVIRCKDCKHHRGENACEKDGCYGWYDTDYCSRAERRGEEEWTK